ncbi:MAG: EAL domain-containing protein [Oculatellaceae cyanobacterium Prado106]|nr:EAL domain-containing protein [Oculatellaceae cyanobacterium Prado106]
MTDPLVTAPQPAFNVTPLNHPLEPYTPLIQAMVGLLGTNSSATNSAAIASPEQTLSQGATAVVSGQILEGVRRSLQADGVAVFRADRHHWLKYAESPVQTDQPLPDGILAEMISHLSAQLLSSQLLTPPQHTEAARFNPFHPSHPNRDDQGEPLQQGGYRSYEVAGVAKQMVLLPLPTHPSYGFMAIWGLPPNSLALSQVFSRMILSLYWATEELTQISPALIEATILDDLCRVYGWVPAALYQRRFELFCDRLSQMLVYFEPVLRLDPDYPYIDSWEALARDPIQDCAPIDLFSAAELWGDRFMVELDAFFVRQAVRSYRNACQFPFGRRQEDLRDLSVNVYPPSLTQERYFEALQQVITDKLIQPEKLILEISEKLPLPSYMPNGQEVTIESFKKHLGQYVRDLKIGFSVDDFGAGHASVSRLTGLNPSHVKIDRDLLYQGREASEITLRFVVDLASSTRLRAPKVVVEGFDQDSPISLGQLYRLGIRYVQGHIIGRASPDLSRLSKERSQLVRQLIRE